MNIHINNTESSVCSEEGEVVNLGGSFSIGLDAGSTTVKVVVSDENQNVIFKDYRRHYADIAGSVVSIFEKVFEVFGDIPVRLAVTGSAGMGIAERCGIAFVQEVVASCEVIRVKFPEIKTLIDIGGEDAKMIFFQDGKSPDMRMNGSCAGGTGAFIDQMTALLNVEMEELNRLSENAKTIYPIASRCGVFSKTDVQNLLSRNVCKEDIAASVFHAVSMQVLTSLARGYDVLPKIFLCGGPFTFIPALRQAFQKQLGLNENGIVLSKNSEVISAWGAAVSAAEQKDTKTLSEYIRLLKTSNKKAYSFVPHQLPPLFKNEEAFKAWKKEKEKYRIESISVAELENPYCFIGIDSGSTTTKIIAMDDKGSVFFRYYERNNGAALDTVAKGLNELLEESTKAGKELIVKSSCVTGYGEDLIKTAFSIDSGMVETIAHYTAACHFNPEVSFILDIGGQDMKAIFIENGAIKRLEINEACSSGCGSFIETFASSLKHTASGFSEIALYAKQPCDLGTRCTVFMNSKVKQSLREGASIADISAGLGYSVIKNCLNKVLKLKGNANLGKHIMVQGGTMRNYAVIRALEIETGRNVMVTDYPELMGAYGAALVATKSSNNKYISLAELAQPSHYTGKQTVCKGCENNCTVTCFTFENGNLYYTGNKCEKIFCNTGDKQEKGINVYEEKYAALFNRPLPSFRREKFGLKLGVVRSLGSYENYPFWHTLFTACGIEVVLSDPSTMKLYEKGIGTVMADNICFPAKLANGHIFNLIDKKVDRIFIPFVVYEQQDDKTTPNSYNCPIVTGYSEVIRSAIDPEKRYGIPFDAPSFTFKDRNLLKKACTEYLRSVLPDISSKTIEKAFVEAEKAQQDYQQTLTHRCEEIARKASDEKRPLILLAGRPYHSDPLIQHKIADIIAGFGADVITEDIVRGMVAKSEEVQSIMQWSYVNRILNAALWVANAPENVHYIQLTSFGCGPDAFILDEATDILRRKGKNATVLKVDDINNLGSTRLRIRSLIESLKFKQDAKVLPDEKPVHTAPYTAQDRKRKILMPWFADFYSPFIPAAFELLGYDAENLPPSDEKTVEYGLKYSNNEICYPATLVVGDFMKALDSGKYKREEIALGITQTGGQCRATNYITLMKKAMIAAGFEDIPVIAVSTGAGTINEQPGFEVDWKKVLIPIVTCMAYADCLSQMYYATAPREREKGIAEKLKQKYIALGVEAVRNRNPKSFYDLIYKASFEFDQANTHADIPRIGIVGEIYVKYNNFGHKNVVNWLIEQGVEPIMPPITNFFSDTFTNTNARVEGNLEESNWLKKTAFFAADKYVIHINRKMRKHCSVFPYVQELTTPKGDARKASLIINTNAQFGEGWRIPAEFAHFSELGVNNVVSLQPFGCIANHIVSKGIEKRARELYPSLNLLFLDFDSGMAEANIFNRLHFMIKNAREELHQNKMNIV